MDSTNVSNTPNKAASAIALRILGGLVVLVSLLTGNLLSILLGIVSCVILFAYAGHIQRLEAIATYLSDIRMACNLQTNRLDIMTRSIMSGGNLESTARQIASTLSDVKDIAEEARDILSTLPADN